MYKLIFAVVIALIALVVAWLGLQPLDKTALALRLDPDKTYKARIDTEWILEYPVLRVRPSGESEVNRHIEFCINPDPDDTLSPGKYQGRGGGMSGRYSFMVASPSFVDTADIQAIREYYLEQFPVLAAYCVSSMVVPLSFDDGLEPLKRAAELAINPIVEDKNEDRVMGHMRRAYQVWYPSIGRVNRNQVVERAVNRLESLYPKKRVTAGSAWEISGGNPGGLPVSEKVEMKLVERKGGTVIMEYKSTSGTDGVPIHIDSCGIAMSVEFSAKIDGLIEIDDSTGLVRDSEFKQGVEGVFRFDSLPGMEPGEAVPFALTARIRAELDETLFSREDGK